MSPNPPKPESPESLNPQAEKNETFAGEVERRKENGEGEKAAEAMEKGEKPKGTDWMTLTGYLSAAAIGGLGIYGGYKVVNWIKEKFEKKEDAPEKSASQERADLALDVREKKSFPWGWGAVAGLAAGGAFLASKFGMGGIFEWAEKAWNVVFHNNTLEKFLKNLKEKGIQAAYDELTYDDSDPFIQTFAEELKIDRKHLSELKTVGYGQFLEHRKKDSKMSYLTRALSFLQIDVKDDIPFSGVDDEMVRVEEERHLAAFLAANKDQLNLSDAELQKLTIGDILQKILEKREEAKKTGGAVPPAGPDAVTPETQTELTIIDNPEEAKGTFGNTMKGIRRAKTSTDGDGMAIEVLSGVYADGAQIVHNGLGTFIVKGTVGLFLTSSEIVWDIISGVTSTMAELATGDFRGAATASWEGLKEYHNDGGTICLATGAAAGVLGALWMKESSLKGFAKGLGWGFLGPVGTITASTKVMGKGTAGTYTFLERLENECKHWALSSRQIAALGKEAQIERYKETALWHGREVKYYYSLSQREEGGIRKISDLGIKYLKHFSPEHSVILENQNIKRFAQSWVDYHNKIGNPKTLMDFPFNLKDFKDKKPEIIEFINKFEEELNVRVNRENVDEAKARLAPGTLDRLPASDRIKALQESTKEADEYLRTTIDKIDELKRAGKHAEADALSRQAETHLREVREGCKRTLESLKGESRQLSKVDQTALKAVLKTQSAHAMGVRGIVREVGSRATGKLQIAFGVAQIVLEVKEVRDQDKEKFVQMKIQEWITEIGPDVLQIVLDVLSPFGLSDWYTVFQGKELITGEDVGTWGRVTRGVFGTYNFTTDVLAAVGGAVTAEAAGAGGAAVYGTSNTIETILRGAGKSPEVIAAVRKILPEVSTLAKDLGGYKELLSTVRKVSQKGMVAVTAIDLSRAAIAGYEIMFDTTDQTPISIELPEAEDLPETDPAGGGSPSSTPSSHPSSNPTPANQAPSESAEGNSGNLAA